MKRPPEERYRQTHKNLFGIFQQSQISSFFGTSFPTLFTFFVFDNQVEVVVELFTKNINERNLLVT